MDGFIQFFGIINVIVFSSTLYLLCRNAKHFNYQKDEFCSLADDPKVGRWFIAYLSLFAINQTLFALVVSVIYKNLIHSGVFPLFAIGGASLCVSAFITMKKHLRLHQFFVVITVLCLTIAVYLITTGISYIFPMISMALVIATGVVFGGLLVRPLLPGIRWETIFLSGIFMWNIILTISFYLL